MWTDFLASWVRVAVKLASLMRREQNPPGFEDIEQDRVDYARELGWDEQERP